MPRISRAKPEWQKKIAKERINILFDEAKRAIKEDRDTVLAKRYMQLAKKIGMRYNVRLGKRRRSFCSNCFNYFYPSVTCRQRLKKGRINILCFNCNKVNRYIIKQSNEK